MGLVDKIKDIFVAPDDEELEEEIDLLENNPASPDAMEKKHLDFDDTVISTKKNKVVNIHATTQLQVVLVKPERFEDVGGIADHLNNKRTIVLNLEDRDQTLCRRVVDFLSGVAYANNGQVKRVANYTFIVTPYNVDIMGELLDELENNGLYF